MNFRVLIAAALCWPLHAMSDNFPLFTTEIPGVQLWALYADGKNFPEEKFLGADNEFIRYCDGTRSIFVSPLDFPIACQAEAIGEGTYRIYLKTTDRRLSGLVVVSKRPLPNRVKSLPITPEEVEGLRQFEAPQTVALAKDAKDYFLRTYPETSAVDYAKYLREIQAQSTYRKHHGARFKLSSPNGFIYISALGLFPDPLGWNIKNVAFREADGGLQKIGVFDGCIKGFRDLNADGTPEVLTTTCENTEGIEDIYWSVAPGVRRVVTR